MLLSHLFSNLEIYKSFGDLDISITSIETDSRKVVPGSLFICLEGTKTDGHNHVHKAIEQGAVAVLSEKKLKLDIPYAIVPDTVRALAVLANVFFKNPTGSLDVIAVTGTNGKTTTTNLIEKILSAHQRKTGLIGTIHMRIGNHIEETKNTTPDALTLQRYFNKMVQERVEYAIIEASSHALQMGRLWGTNIKTAVFTNLTQDHLDFHSTMEEYLQAKSLLFSQLGSSYKGKKFAILNRDDETFEYLKIRTSAQVVTYGIEHESDVWATNIQLSSSGSRFDLHTYKGNAQVHLKLIGKFNIYNALAAITACLVEEVPLPEIISSLESIEGVKGRFESLCKGQNFQVIIDYAHTPDGLENVLRTAKEITPGNVICVVGCGGDRDRGKRPIMAQIANEYSHTVVLTSDNPRSENPHAIIEDMKHGVTFSSEVYTLIDRKEAISFALQKAKPGDTVLIAGKGHENYQITKDGTIPFDDKEIALEILEKIK